jgi:hypothetical protein
MCDKIVTLLRHVLAQPYHHQEVHPKLKTINSKMDDISELYSCRSIPQLKPFCKVHPVTGHEGPEVEYRCNSTLSLTSALDEGGWSTPRPGRFTPGKDPVPIVQEAGWATGPVWTGAENLDPLDRPPRSESPFCIST